MRILLFPASGQPFPNVLKFSLAQRSSDTDVSLWWCLVIIRPNYGSPRLWLDKMDSMLKRWGWGGGGACWVSVCFKWAVLYWGVSHGPQQIATVDTSELWDCRSPTEAWSGSNSGSNHCHRCWREKLCTVLDAFQERILSRNHLNRQFFLDESLIASQLSSAIADHYQQRERT